MIEIVGQNKIDISLVSEYSKNILRQIAKNSNYTRVVISSTARLLKFQDIVQILILSMWLIFRIPL